MGDTVNQNLDTNKNSNNAFLDESLSESNDETEAGADNVANSEQENDANHLSGGMKVTGDSGAGIEERDSAECFKQTEPSPRCSILMNAAESQGLDRQVGTNGEDFVRRASGERGESDMCALASSGDTNENYDDERNDRQVNQQGRGRGIGRRGLTHRPAVLDYGLPDDNIGLLDEDFDFILTVDPNTAATAHPLEPTISQAGGSNDQGQQNPIAVDEAHQSSDLAVAETHAPVTPAHVVSTDDLQSVARNYNNPTLPTASGNLADLILDSTVSDADNATNQQDLPVRGSQLAMSDVLCSEYACTLESNMLEMHSSNEDDTTAESILTASSSLRREIKISLPVLNVDLTPANIISKGIEEISPNLIVDPDTGSPMDDTPDDNSNSHPNSSASDEDELQNEQELASAENDFRSLDFALIKESMTVEKERTEQDADALLDQVIGGFKDKGMGPNNADTNASTCSDIGPISVGKASEEKRSASHVAPLEDGSSPDKTGEDVSIVSLNSSPDVYNLNFIECDSQSNAKVAARDDYLAKDTISLSKDCIIDKCLHDDVGEPYVNNSVCIDEVGVDSHVLLANETKPVPVDDRDVSCIQHHGSPVGIESGPRNVHSYSYCPSTLVETDESKHVISEVLNCEMDGSDKGNSDENEDCQSLQVAQAIEDIVSAAVAASHTREDRWHDTRSINHTDGINTFQSPGEIDPKDTLSNAQQKKHGIIDEVFSGGKTDRDALCKVTDTEHTDLRAINSSPEANHSEPQCMEVDADATGENMYLHNNVENICKVVSLLMSGIDEGCKLATSHSNEKIQCISKVKKTDVEVDESKDARQQESSNSSMNFEKELHISEPHPQIETECLSDNTGEDGINKTDTHDVNDENAHFLDTPELTTGAVEVKNVASDGEDVNTKCDTVETQEDIIFTEPSSIDDEDTIESNHVNEALNVLCTSVTQVDNATPFGVAGEYKYDSSLHNDIKSDNCSQDKDPQEDLPSSDVQVDRSTVAFTTLDVLCNELHHVYDHTHATHSPSEVHYSSKEVFLKEMSETETQLLESSDTRESVHDISRADNSDIQDSHVNISDNTICHEDNHIKLEAGAAEFTEFQHTDAGTNDCRCLEHHETLDVNNEIDSSPIGEQVSASVPSESQAENQLSTTPDVQTGVDKPLYDREVNGVDQQKETSPCKESFYIHGDNQEEYASSANCQLELANGKQFEACLRVTDQELKPPTTIDFEISTCDEHQDTDHCLKDTDVRQSDADCPLLYTDRYERFCCHDKTLYEADNKVACCVQVENEFFYDSDDQGLKYVKGGDECFNDSDDPGLKYAKGGDECFNDSDDPGLKYAKGDDEHIGFDKQSSGFVVDDLDESRGCKSLSCSLSAAERTGEEQERGASELGKDCMNSRPSSNDLQTCCGDDDWLAENIERSFDSAATRVENDVCIEVDEGHTACLEVRGSDFPHVNAAERQDNVEIEECFFPRIADYDSKFDKSESENICADDILKIEPSDCLHRELITKLLGDVGTIDVESNSPGNAISPQLNQEEFVFDGDNFEGSRPGTCTPGFETQGADGEKNTTVLSAQSTPAFEPEELRVKLLHLEVTLEESSEDQIVGYFQSTAVGDKSKASIVSPQQEENGNICVSKNNDNEEDGMKEACVDSNTTLDSLHGDDNIIGNAYQKEDISNHLQLKSPLPLVSVNKNNFDEMPLDGSDDKVSSEAPCSESIYNAQPEVIAKKEEKFNLEEHLKGEGNMMSDKEGTITSTQLENRFVLEETPTLVGPTLSDSEVRRDSLREDTGIDSSLVAQASKDFSPNTHPGVDSSEVICKSAVDKQEVHSEAEDLRGEHAMSRESGSNISTQQAPESEVCRKISSSSLIVACARRLSQPSSCSMSASSEMSVSAERIIQNPNDDMFPVAKVILDATDVWLNKISDYCQSSEMLVENPSKLQEIAHECTSQLVSLTQSSEFCQEHAQNVALLSRSGTKTQSVSSVHSGIFKNTHLAPLSDSSCTTVSIKSHPRCYSSNASLLRQANLCCSRISANSETRLDLQNRIAVPSEVSSSSRLRERRDIGSLSSNSSSCSSMLSEKTNGKTSLIALGSSNKLQAVSNEGSGRDFQPKVGKKLNGVVTQLHPRPRSTGSSCNDHTNKPHMPRPNSSKATSYGKSLPRDDITSNQHVKKQQPKAKESEASKGLVVEEKTDRKSNLTPCAGFENNKQGALLEKRRQPHPPPSDQQECQGSVFKRVMGHLEHGAQFTRGQCSRNSAQSKAEQNGKDSVKQNRSLGIVRRPLLRSVATQRSSESDRKTPVGQSSDFIQTDKAQTQRTCHPLTFKFKGQKIPLNAEERAECKTNHEISLGTGDYSVSQGKDITRHGLKTEEGQAAGESHGLEKKDQESQDSKMTQISRQRIGPLKLREHISKKGKSTKMLTMQEFERIQADRHLNQAFARIQSSKPCVDCHMDAKVMDKTGASVKRRRERVNYDNLIALENIKFLEMLRFKKSAYDRDEQLKEFKGLKGVEGKNTKLKQIKAATLV